MNSTLNPKLRAAGDIDTDGTAAKWCETAVAACLFLFALSAPLSIAAAQTAWLLGMFLWLLRFAFYPPPRIYRTPLDYPLLGFFILTGLSAFFSYEPMVSTGKLRGASLFTIVYLFAENIPSRRVLRLLVITLLASFMVTVLYTAGQRVIGRGVKVHGVAAGSPLSAAIMTEGRNTAPQPIREGDTITEVDGTWVRNAEDLALALDASHGPGAARVKIYRAEWAPILQVQRGALLPGTTPEQRLGILDWSRGRDWRASGFYGHYVTYAEALQLVLALALGMLVSLPVKRSLSGVLLVLTIVGLGFALTLTVTRAPWLAFLVSSAVILFLGASRKVIIVAAALAIPVVFAGLFILQQKRNVAFLDQRDNSTTWRETVWREGFDLLVSKPRHMLLGVGMDSIKGHRREWGLFDKGRLPPGHMHSNMLQLALERGIPALILWLVFLGLYALMLWRLVRSKLIDDWIERGVVLGALGGTCGFFTSGLVHYNWGDSEVVMIFYLIVGLTLVIERRARLNNL